MRYIRFIFWGIFYIAPAEFIINTMIIAGAGMGKFLGAVAIYTFLLTIYYLWNRRSLYTPSSRRSKFFGALLLGCFGLFIMEWIIIGNSPWGNPDAVQSSMFIWWIWVFLFPKVMVVELYRPIRKRILIYQIFYSILFFIVIAITKIPLSFVIIYAFGLWVFFIFLYSYIRLPEDNPPTWNAVPIK